MKRFKDRVRAQEGEKIFRIHFTSAEVQERDKSSARGRAPRRYGTQAKCWKTFYDRVRKSYAADRRKRPYKLDRLLDHLDYYYVANAFVKHSGKYQRQWLISTNVASGLGIIALRALKKGETLTIPVLWAANGSVCKGRKSSKRKKSESEAIARFGAVMCIRNISGPASYLNDGCPRCANIEQVKDGIKFQDFVCTKPIPKGTELKFSYSVIAETGEEVAPEPGDTPDESQCCQAGGN